MQFLIDEDLPRSTGNLLRRYGHEAIDVRDIGLRGARDSQIAYYAQSKPSWAVAHQRIMKIGCRCEGQGPEAISG